MSLTFHQTFFLECDNLAKVLSLIVGNPHISNVEISDATGIGIGKDPRQGKVQPTLDYMVYSGLVKPCSDKGRKLELTDVAKIILENDEWLKKPCSHWVMHYFLSRKDSQAEAWAFFIHEFLPRFSDFDRTVLEKELENKFGERVKVKSINPGVLLSTYLDNNSLGRIRIIREPKKKSYTKTDPYIPNTYLVSYILAEIWETTHFDRSMISPDELSESGHLGTAMALNKTDLQYWVDEMTSLGIVGQMREAPPYQIVRHWNDKLELLRKAYQET